MLILHSLQRVLATALLIVSFIPVRADEGMWLPLLLEQLNIEDMKARGFKLSAADIYSVNSTSMKDAVCQFGGGCTAELISGQGLLLTNHHCGYGQIQSHSSLEHDYLTNGFWAMSKEEEIPCPGLTVTFILSMKEVTADIMNGISSNLPEAKRNEAIQANIKRIEKENTKDGNEAMVRAFYYGNIYYLFITETYRDVRMVGAPPTAIGNFGGDTDNWIWPRHTGDFSMFRIYSAKDNKPAEYSKDNVPYQPRKFFPVSLRGVEENDFTMVYGFPGRTTEYLSSWAVNLIGEVSDPIKVDLRTTRLRIMKSEMNQNDVVRIQYAAKYNSVSNAWKKWQGEMKGLRDNNAVKKKQDYERDFQTRVEQDATLKTNYSPLLQQLEKAYADLRPWQIAVDNMAEGCLSVELLRFAVGFKKLVEESQAKVIDQKELEKMRDALLKGAAGFYKDFNAVVDQRIAEATFSANEKGMDPNAKPAIFAEISNKGDFSSYFKKLYKKSVFANQPRLIKLLTNYKPSDYKKIVGDRAYDLAIRLFDHYSTTIQAEYNTRMSEINRLNRLYMQAQMDVFKEKKFYPDANSTLRVAFGQIDDYTTKEGKHFDWYTTLDGLIAKETDTIPDYKVPERLKQLYNAKDFGNYAAADGRLHTCFIATNHTTGGNSGSPVLDAEGNLIGTNFDRCWEGTMSDINYDASVCRNITLDVRYTLFIIDKYAGAGYLLNEMQIIR